MGATSVKRVGRPRDPHLEDRVFDAAMLIYSQSGWLGFTFDSIARAATVGKASIYSRWRSRGDLLRAAMERRWLAPQTIDNGDIKQDLCALAFMVAGVLTGPYSRVHARMRVDLDQYPELLGFLRPYIEGNVRLGKRIVRRAVERGELPPHTNSGLVMDLLVGSVTNHISTTPAELRGAMLGKLDEFVDEVICVILAGVIQSSSFNEQPLPGR